MTRFVISSECCWSSPNVTCPGGVLYHPPTSADTVLAHMYMVGLLHLALVHGSGVLFMVMLGCSCMWW